MDDNDDNPDGDDDGKILTYSDLSKLVKTCRDLSKLAKTCQNLPKLVKTW